MVLAVIGCTPETRVITEIVEREVKVNVTVPLDSELTEGVVVDYEIDPQDTNNADADALIDACFDTVEEANARLETIRSLQPKEG